MFKRIQEFHKAFGVKNQTKPNFPDQDTRDLRVRLLQEEFKEYLQAEKDNDLVEVADGLADILVIALGTADVYGLPIEEIFAEVHASNMSKLKEDGTPLLREDGKILKNPTTYFKARIKEIIEKHTK